MKVIRMFAVVLALTVVSGIGWSSGQADAGYPEKPIIIVVPFGAGGGFDRLARALAPHLEKELGVPIIIRNIPGSGGRRGSINLFRSKPDGYTIGFSHFVPFQTDGILLGRKPAVDYKKFAVILQVSHSKHFLFVNKNLPFKSLKDLKGAGRPIKFSGTGIGAITWVEGSAVGATVGFPVKFVTGYKSLPRAALAVAKGDVDAGIGSSHHFQGVAGDVRPLVFLGAKRDHHYPDVPTVAEAGYPKLTALGSPRVLSAPPGTPEERLEIVRKALRKTIGIAEFGRWAKEAGYYLDPKEPAAVWKTLKTNAQIYESLRPLIQKSRGR